MPNTTQTGEQVNREQCDHPDSARFTHDFGQGGYLNTPTGKRILCADCGTDLTGDVYPPEEAPAEHTLTLMRDDDRLGGRYGQHYYVERMGTSTVKVEYLDGVYDRDQAHHAAWAAAKLYGARLIDRRPDACLYGWSA